MVAVANMKHIRKIISKLPLILVGVVFVFILPIAARATPPSAMFILPFTSDASSATPANYPDSYEEASSHAISYPCSTLASCETHWTPIDSYFLNIENSCSVDGQYKTYSRHQGSDFFMDKGTPIYAAASGTVHTYEQKCIDGTQCYYDPGSSECPGDYPCYKSCPVGDKTSLGTASGDNSCYGKYISIDHGDGTWTKYAHLSSYVVTNGYVNQNDPIALSGETGTNGGAHLHFEVLTDTSTVNNPYACNNEWFVSSTPTFANPSGIPESFPDCTISSSYFCSSGSTSAQPDSGTWTDAEVMLDVELALTDTVGTFTVSKHDGSDFISAGTMSLKVGGYETDNKTRTSQDIPCSADDPGCSAGEVTLTDDFGCHNITGYPKNYYLRFDQESCSDTSYSTQTSCEAAGSTWSATGSYETVGPISVHSELLANTELSVPQNLVVESLGPNSLGMYWDDVSGATEYRICRSTVDSTDDGFSQIYWNSDSIYEDAGADHLASDTTYYYKVAAGNSSGWSDFSTVHFATTKADGESTGVLARTSSGSIDGRGYDGDTGIDDGTDSLSGDTGDGGSSSCTVPVSGDWTVSSDCTISAGESAPANVRVDDGITLTISGTGSLDMNLSSYHLTIGDGSRVIIEVGGKID